MKSLPDGPWHTVSVDFFGPVGSEYLLVLVDDYTRYPIVEIVSSTSAKSVLPKLHQIFSMFGIPRIVNSDNGPPFQSAEFQRFAEYCGFTHHKVTPRWPRANGEAERFMRNIKKTIQTAQLDGYNWRQSLHTYLAQYRGTPHMSTLISPHKALFGREPFMKIPDLACKSRDQTLQANDAIARSRIQNQANRRPHARQSFKIGDKVLIRNDKTGKFIPTFNPVPGTVVSIKGTQVTVRREGKVFVRNESFLKKLNGSVQTPPRPVRTPRTFRSPNPSVPIPLHRHFNNQPQPVRPVPQNVQPIVPNAPREVIVPAVPRDGEVVIPPVPPIDAPINIPHRSQRKRQEPAYLRDYVQ
jgi:hypothetical protein